MTQHPAPQDAEQPQRGGLGLVHIAFKVGSYAALREAYAHLLANGVEIQRAVDHVCQRSFYFTDPDGNGLEIYYEMPGALSLFPNGRGDEDERLPLSGSRRAAPRLADRGLARARRLRQGRAPAPRRLGQAAAE